MSKSDFSTSYTQQSYELCITTYSLRMKNLKLMRLINLPQEAELCFSITQRSQENFLRLPRLIITDPLSWKGP